ncbi:MAG: NTP transferase domain-containing protein [Prevotella sp.]|nr:NTP transferase domain-containing protein [Prevotella sp.]
MKYAVIAAGEGSRLISEGINVPKPLLDLNGEPLIDRLLRVFLDNDADEIYVVCNNISPFVCEHLSNLQINGLNHRHLPLHFTVKTTPSSMHSFFELSKWLNDSPFCLTTVDTVFLENEFSHFIHDFKYYINNRHLDGLMGVTDFIDDEKPLFVDTDNDMNITGFLDDNNNNCKFISGGIYALTPKSIQILSHCINRGVSRMRNFQRALISEKCRLKAWKFSKILDIDHAADIQKAQLFLSPNP